MVGLSEGQIKAAIKTEQAVNSGIDRETLSLAVGDDASLNETIKAIDDIKAENNPKQKDQDKKFKEVTQAIANHLKTLNGHDHIMTYLESLITQTKSKPEQEALIPLAA